jgi:hypothetical protein
MACEHPLRGILSLELNGRAMQSRGVNRYLQLTFVVAFSARLYLSCQPLHLNRLISIYRPHQSTMRGLRRLFIDEGLEDQ